jgi:anti-anti-sigma regulatory factor
MLKISIIDSRTHRRLVLEGKLVGAWADELRPAWEKAKAKLGGRELVVEVKNLIVINQAGEDVLLELMREGVKVRGCGVFPRQILKELARRVERKDKER